MLYRDLSVQIIPTLGPRLNLAAAVLFGAGRAEAFQASSGQNWQPQAHG